MAAADQGADRGDRDDPAAVALGDHLVGRRLGAEEDALQVDVLDPVPQLLGHRQELVEWADAGVIDEDVEAAEGGDRLGDHRLDLGLDRDIGRDGDGLSSLRRDRGHDSGGVLVAGFGRVGVDDDFGAGFGQAQADTPADAA